MPYEREDGPPMENDEWFERHVVPKINKLEKNETGIYIIPIALCWDRHDYYDAYAGLVELSVFPRRVITPQKWGPNFAHAVRFFKTLKSKLDSFKDKPNELQRVDLRLYTSGASGPKEAFKNAWDDKVPRQGFPFFAAPITWSMIPCGWNSATQKYEEEPLLTSYPERKLSEED